MKKLLLAFAFIGFLITSNFAADISTSFDAVQCDDNKDCTKKDCKHDNKKSEKREKKSCKKGDKKSCCSKDKSKSCKKEKNVKKEK